VFQPIVTFICPRIVKPNAENLLYLHNALSVIESQHGYYGYQWHDIQFAVFNIGFYRNSFVYDIHDKAEEIGLKVENVFSVKKK
jgi:hypothetical protein